MSYHIAILISSGRLFQSWGAGVHHKCPIPFIFSIFDPSESYRNCELQQLRQYYWSFSILSLMTKQLTFVWNNRKKYIALNNIDLLKTESFPDL